MNRKQLFFLALSLISVAVIVIYLFWGAPGKHILLTIRLPRLLLACLTGMVLAGVGYVYQIMLNNPLAEPYILGVSSGAAFGSILAGILGLYLLIPVFSFSGAIVTTSLVWALAHLGGYFNKIKLILSGIIIGLFFSALISLLMYFNQKDIGTIINVLMGNLGYIFNYNEWKMFIAIFFLSLGLMGYMYYLINQLLILTTGDLVAASLGLDVKRLRRRIFITASLLTGATVAYAGVIGFIGLIIPHLTRMIQGGNNRFTYVYAVWMGAIFILLCDLIAMNIAVVEIPVGIVTAFIGCPFFIFVMLRSK
jgi:iron complex transport system permease protein